MFADTEIAGDILKKRYYADGETEPQELVRRVAKFISTAEKEVDRNAWAEKFYKIMMDGKFLPNSPCLVNAGQDNGGLFACFVLGMEDDLSSISKAKADAMAITKFGGGWGVGLSALRPRGSRVRGSTHGVAGGPVGFWETFSADADTMTQGGFRAAACMATLDIKHPDSEEFIGAKAPVNSVIRLLNLDKLAKDNDDAVAVAQGLLGKSDTIKAAAETHLSNFNMSVLVPDDFMEMALLRRNDLSMQAEFNGEQTGQLIYPNSLLDKVVINMWHNGEPGILFIDTIRGRTKYDPELVTSTNPCGEQPLPPNGSCCLGSLNLSEFCDGNQFAWKDFADAIYVAVRFLDNMITLNKFPTPETAEWSAKNRSIGLGVMGFADVLIKLNIRYDSESAVDFARSLSEFMYHWAEVASAEILKEKGGRAWGRRRNNVLLSIAPTGTISLLAGCSAGIEPIFDETITRIDQTGTHVIKHPLSEKDSFVTVKDVDPKAIVNIVAAFSIHIDSSVSYTVNMPNDATIEDIRDIVTYAWTNKCNGITVYRDGSRKMQVLNREDEAVEGKKKRPHILEGRTFKFPGRIDGESKNLYVTINVDDAGKPFEVFVHTPRIDSVELLQLVTAVTRMSSLALRSGASLEDVIKQLSRVEGQTVLSIPKIVATALEQHLDSGDKICGECGGRIIYGSGCWTCESCGYSTCG